jgi:hypothetical protein
MRRRRLTTAALLAALLSFATLRADDTWTGGGGGGGAGGSCDTLGGELSGTCTNATIVGPVGQSEVTNLTTDLANLAAQIGSQTAPPGTQSAVLSGSCGVNWSGSGYIYNVAACSAFISGTQYSAAATNITLTAADGSNPRIDAIVINTTAGGTIAKVDGTAAANPSTPTIDTTTQLVLAYITVGAGTSTPTGATNEIIHDGTDTTAWTGTAGTGWTLNDTGNPHGGTKDVKATAISANAFTKFVRTTTLTLDSYQQLAFWVAPGSGTWGNGRQLQLTIRNANAQQVGNMVTLSNGAFGFDRTSTSYQLVVIPIGLFKVPAGTAVKELRLNPAGTGGTFTFYVDDLMLQTNTNTLLPAGASYATLYLDANGVPTGTGPGSSGQVLTSQGASAPPLYATASSGGKPFWEWSANQAILGTSSYPQFATRNVHPVLDYDASADECAYFEGVLAPSYAGGGLTVDIDWVAASATSGATGWLTAFERHDSGTDLDADSFGTEKSASTTTSGTSGAVTRTTIAHTSGAEIDSLAAGEAYRLRLCRDGNGSTVTDSMTGDAELVHLDVREP